MTRNSILNEIVASLPIERGDTVWVTANLTRLAFMLRRAGEEFYPAMLINILKERLGEEGTLVIPAFNHNLKRNDTFDVKNTRPETGALALSLMGRDDFIRTRHPLHSFYSWGKLAKTLGEVSNLSSFGPDSPFSRLLEENAKFLLIGTRVKDAFSFTHFVEEQMQVGYRRFRTYRIRYTDEHGMTKMRKYQLYAKKPGWDMCLDKLEKRFEEEGILWQKQIRGTTFTVAELKDAYGVIKNDIENNRARNIACFDPKLYLRTVSKAILQKTLKYRTTSDKITP